jgi:tRNA-dependent cyclodipeptide synthase
MRRLSASIKPASARGELQRFDRCLYAVSIGGANKPIEDVVEGYRWALGHFPRVCILLGDSLYRFTLQIQHAVEAKAAVEEAHRYSQAVLHALFERVEKVPEVIRCSDVLKHAQFSKNNQEVQDLFENEPRFRASIVADAGEFVHRQALRGRLGVPIEVATALASAYLIEEVAIYGCLAQQGWLVDVYLGSELPTLEKFIAGEFISSTVPLDRRVNVGLRFK